MASSIDYLRKINLRFSLLSLIFSFIFISLYSTEKLKTFAFEANIYSQFKLGIFYSKGTNKDLLESYYWMKMAAKGKHPNACRYVGRAHLYGLGTSKNTDLAKKWFLISAQNGDALSMVGLAKCLESEGNLIKSSSWFKLAYKYGEQNAIQSFNRIVKKISEKDQALLDEVINNLESSITVTKLSYYPDPKSNQKSIQRIELVNGNSYWGEVVKGLPQGYGKKSSTYGTTYQGEFKNGIEDGYGTSFDQSGKITYQGIWKLGNPL